MTKQDPLWHRIKLYLMIKGINFWGPLRGAGIRVTGSSDHFTAVHVELRQKWNNRNIVGVHFGGSLYAMCDPFFMWILMHHLGTRYIVWDKAARIRFRRPGRGTVKATFRISPDKIAEVKRLANEHGKYEETFHVQVIDSSGAVVAEVEKLLYVKAKDHQPTPASASK